MFQEITTYLIVFIASAYTLYSMIRMIIPKKKNTNSSCYSCSSNCSSCDIAGKIKIKTI